LFQARWHHDPHFAQPVDRDANDRPGALIVEQDGDAPAFQVRLDHLRPQQAALCFQHDKI